MIHFLFCSIEGYMAIETKPAESKENPFIEEMIRAGLHFGHKTSKTHPGMKPYISGMRNAIHIIDVKFTQLRLDEALAFLRKFREENKIILMVGTRTSIRGIVKETALAVGCPFVAERWIGGTLTNFDMTQKRLDELKELGIARERGDWQKYTKKEQAELLNRMESLEEKFGGIKQLTGPPAAVFVCDVDENKIAVREAKKLGIPVVAIVDTNNDPKSVDYPIPANNDASSSVGYILSKVRQVLSAARLPQPGAEATGGPGKTHDLI